MSRTASMPCTASIQVETAGDCYIVAGALMRQDEEGFLALEESANAHDGAFKVMAFAKVGRPVMSCALEHMTAV